MSTRLQSIRDTLQSAVDSSFPNDHLGRLVRKALLQANIALDEYPQRPPVKEPVLHVNGVPYSAKDVADLSDALVLATRTLAAIGESKSQDVTLLQRIANTAYGEIIYTKEKLHADSDRTT